MLFIFVTFSLACNQQTENTPKQSKTSVETEKLPMKNIDATQTAKVSTATQSKAIPMVARKYGCLGCHAIGKKIIGPSWQDVAHRYANDPNATKRLFNSISNGSQGKWPKQVGNLAMPPHSYMKNEDITQLAIFIMSLNK